MSDTWNSFQTGWEPLLELRAAWLEEYEREAKGALGSLKGFEFQFHVYLLRIVSEWLHHERGDALRSRPSVLLEYLADIVQSSPEAVWVTEVKYRQSSSKVKKAMSEFWKIERLARRRVPELAPKLRYKLVSAKRELKNVDRAIARWEPTEVAASNLQRELADFKRRIVAEILESPRDELLGLLVNKLKVTEEPISIISDWTNALLSAASGKKPVIQVAEELFSRLGALTNQRELPGAWGDAYLWTHEDCPPATVQPGPVLTGQRPLVKHLREGYFANRAELFEGIAEDAAAWIGEQRASPDVAERIPVFWIGGRSGSGKSVALLHVLSNLFEFGYRPILWLGRNISSLRRVFGWSRGLRVDGQRVILGLDDPFTPGNNASVEWRRALSALEEVRNSGNTDELPLLFCCGPPEQFHRLQREFCEELNLHLSEIERESAREIESLRSWFRQRRDKEPPDLDHDNVLLVQLFFEWRTGQPLSQFASRFRDRIRLADHEDYSTKSLTLEEFLSTMLAANRLYVGLPTAALDGLSPLQKDSLRQLRREHHIEDVASEVGGTQEIWLAHAHLSNAIFESWFPSGDTSEQRAEFGSKVDALWLKSGSSPSERMALIWALGAVLLEKYEDIARRLDEEELSLLLGYMYDTHKSNGLELWQLPAWIQVCASRHAESLTPHPVAMTVSKLETVLHRGAYETKGLRLTCTKLLEFFDRWQDEVRQKLLQIITGLLVKNPQWYEWPYVAFEVLPYS